MILKERLRNDYNKTGSFNSSKGGKKETCKRFNKGKCTSGLSCRYEHKCLNCGKFGHGAHICRKKNSLGQMDADKQDTGSGNSSK